MSESQPVPPDFLRRFTPTPYVFELRANEECLRIEADDLEIALAIRGLCRGQIDRGVVPVRFWRLIQDQNAPGYGPVCEVFKAGALTTITHRTGTVLIFDRTRRELFGFLGAGLTTQELIGGLLPQLFGGGSVNLPDSVFYKQVTNSTLHSDNLQASGSLILESRPRLCQVHEIEDSTIAEQ